MKSVYRCQGIDVCVCQAIVVSELALTLGIFVQEMVVVEGGDLRCLDTQSSVFELKGETALETSNVVEFTTNLKGRFLYFMISVDSDGILANGRDNLVDVVVYII